MREARLVAVIGATAVAGGESAVARVDVEDENLQVRSASKEVFDCVRAVIERM